MSTRSIQPLPPKTAELLGARARRGNYDRNVGSGIFEFVSGNLISTLMCADEGKCFGHVRRDPRGAKQILASKAVGSPQ